MPTASPVVQLAYAAFAFLPFARLRAGGAARKPFLSALVPARLAVRVIVFNTLRNDRLQAVVRIRLAIAYPSLELVRSIVRLSGEAPAVSACWRTLAGLVRYGR